jgi:hypothetical protein
VVSGVVSGEVSVVVGSEVLGWDVSGCVALGVLSA